MRSLLVLALILTWAVVATGFFLLAFVGIGDLGNVFDRTTTGAPQVRGADSYVLATTDDETTPANAGEPVSGDFRFSRLDDPTLTAALEPGLMALATQPNVALVVTPSVTLPGPAFLRTLFGTNPAQSEGACLCSYQILLINLYAKEFSEVAHPPCANQSRLLKK